jgi:hypothetical protein
MKTGINSKTESLCCRAKKSLCENTVFWTEFILGQMSDANFKVSPRHTTFYALWVARPPPGQSSRWGVDTHKTSTGCKNTISINSYLNELILSWNEEISDHRKGGSGVGCILVRDERTAPGEAACRGARRGMTPRRTSGSIHLDVKTKR